MDRPTTLADIAKAAGVSKGTASNVFNRPELVRPEVRERVEDCCRRMNYSGPDPKGRLLRAGKVNAIGVIVHDRLSTILENSYDLIMLRGIAEVCDAKGAGMALVSASSDDGSAVWSIKSAVVDGFIVFCMEDDETLVDEVRRRGLPFVAIDLDAGAGASSVHVDDRGGARLAADHLIGLGHRRFGILSLELADDDHYGLVGPERRARTLYEVTRDRLAGYGDALGLAGIDLDHVPIMEVALGRKEAADATAELLAGAPDITAILAMADTMALGALDHARAAGIRVPGRLSIVGYDGIPETAATDPPLTTIVQPIREKGRLAAEILFDGGLPRTERLDVELIVRASTSKPG